MKKIILIKNMFYSPFIIQEIKLSEKLSEKIKVFLQHQQELCTEGDVLSLIPMFSDKACLNSNVIYILHKDWPLILLGSTSDRYLAFGNGRLFSIDRNDARLLTFCRAIQNFYLEEKTKIFIDGYSLLLTLILFYAISIIIPNNSIIFTIFTLILFGNILIIFLHRFKNYL